MRSCGPRSLYGEAVSDIVVVREIFVARQVVTSCGTGQVTVLPGSLVDGEPAGPKMNMYIKPNKALNSVNTLGPAGLLAMLDDLQQAGTRGICVSTAPVVALGLDTAVATITGAI